MYPSARDRKRFRIYAIVLVVSVLAGLAGGLTSGLNYSYQSRQFERSYVEIGRAASYLAELNLETPIAVKEWAKAFLSIWLEAGESSQALLNEWMTNPVPSLTGIAAGARRVITVEAIETDTIGSHWVVFLVAQTARRTSDDRYVADPTSWWKVTAEEGSGRWWAAFAPRQVTDPLATAPPAPALLFPEDAINNSSDPRWEQNAINWVESFLTENIGTDYAFDRLTHPDFKGFVDAEGVPRGGIHDHWLRSDKYDTATVVRMQMINLAASAKACLCEVRASRTGQPPTVLMFPVVLFADSNTEPRIFLVGDDALQLIFESD